MNGVEPGAIPADTRYFDHPGGRGCIMRGPPPAPRTRPSPRRGSEARHKADTGEADPWTPVGPPVKGPVGEPTKLTQRPSWVFARCVVLNTDSNASLIELEEVEYELDGNRIIDRVSWSISPGENWSIIGPNGSGKTTLLKIACGRLWPNAGGRVYRQGEEQVNLSELWKRIGWVSQELLDRIPDRQSALDTVVAGKFSQKRLVVRRDYSLDEADYDRARGILEDLGFEHLSQRRFKTLSQGEKQIVLIARALMSSPFLIALDEPCAGLDPGSRETFLDGLGRLARQRTDVGLIYTTHHVEEILPEFSHLLALKNGGVLQQGALKEVLSETLLQRLYGLPITLERRDGRYWPLTPS